MLSDARFKNFLHLFPAKSVLCLPFCQNVCSTNNKSSRRRSHSQGRKGDEIQSPLYFPLLGQRTGDVTTWEWKWCHRLVMAFCCTECEETRKTLDCFLFCFYGDAATGAPMGTTLLLLQNSVFSDGRVVFSYTGLKGTLGLRLNWSWHFWGVSTMVTERAVLPSDALFSRTGIELPVGHSR